MAKCDKIGFFIGFKGVWQQFSGEVGNITTWKHCPMVTNIITVMNKKNYANWLVFDGFISKLIGWRFYDLWCRIVIAHKAVYHAVLILQKKNLTTVQAVLFSVWGIRIYLSFTNCLLQLIKFINKLATNSLPKRQSRSLRMSSASNWTDTSSCLKWHWNKYRNNIVYTTDH